MYLPETFIITSLAFAWMKRENKKRERGERECEKREI
jgi:hypothetical protein